MATLGSAKTKKFAIGTAEVRIGPQSSAGRLTSAHSIGVVDKATVAFDQKTVDLMGGFPQVPIDTAIVGQEAKLNATLREFSRRNLNILLGNGVATYDTTDVKATVDTTSGISANATTIPVDAVAGFTVGDTVVISVLGYPELVTVSTIASIDSSPPDNIVLTTGLGLAAAIPINSTCTIFKSPAVAIGNLSTVNYFAVQLVQLERSTNRPMVFDFWKATVASGVNYDTNATDFASTELQLKMLEPASVEYGASQPLEHLATIIPSFPVGRFVISSDAA